MNDYNSSINRIFTKKVFNELLNKGTNDVYDYVVRRYISNAESKTNRELISEIYIRLSKQYRNEYYYTNTLLNKLLVGIHSVNTTTALAQVRIADHIADFVLINGEGHVYEIKSDRDNLERLNSQITDYYRAFSKVSVLASESELDHVKHLLDKLGPIGECVGIYVLTDKDTIFDRINSKSPIEWNEKLEHKCLFNLLRKKDYETVIKDYYGNTPTVPPVFYYKECLKLFTQIPILDAQKSVLNMLKKRNQIDKLAFQSVPKELRSIVYFSGLSKKVSELDLFLQQVYQGR